MLSCYFFLPVSFAQLQPRRSKLHGVLCNLVANIANSPQITRFAVHIHLNGDKPEGIDSSNYRDLLPIPASVPAIVTSSAIPDKILAVNLGLDEARRRRFDLFFCVDNDIDIPPNTVRHMIELFEANKTDGVVCEKAPLVHRKSNEFQLLFSTFVSLALTYQIFPNRRPTGSFYCIDPLKIYWFPLGCNEGDFLARHKIVHTNSFVYSEYPNALQTEVERRKRILLASEALDYVRDIQNIEYVEHIERRLPFPRHILTSHFRSSFALYKQVIQLVSED